MKRTSMTICVICVLLLTSLTNAYAQSAPKKTSSNASDEFVFNVERMFNEGMLVQMPVRGQNIYAEFQGTVTALK